MHVTRKLAVLAMILFAAPSAMAAVYSTPTRDVENPDRAPYLEYKSGSISPPFVNTFMYFPTPNGSRVVIEYVTLSCTTPSATDTMTQVALVVTKQLSSSSSTSFSAANIPMQRVGPAFFGGYAWEGSMLIKTYSDPQLGTADGGQGIYLNIFHTESSQTVSCAGSLSGHLFTP